MTTTVEQEFTFSYGHRNHMAKDAACRQIHGHTANVRVVLDHSGNYNSAFDLVRNFLHSIDHHLILHLEDPWLINITNLEPIYENYQPTKFKSWLPLNTSSESFIPVIPMYDRLFGQLQYNTAGYFAGANQLGLQGPERDFINSFLFVRHNTALLNMASWLFLIARSYAWDCDTTVLRVDWQIAPNIKCSYSE